MTASDAPSGGRHLGITVMPEYIQSEGIEAVLDRLVDGLGVTAITTSPCVAAVSEPGIGTREPPLDGGAGSVRVLDRPLWGQRALHMVTAPSFVPDRSLYRPGGYEPPPPTSLTEAEGPVLGRFISAAKARGVAVYLQVMAAIPPCLKVQFGGPDDVDKPMLPDGTPVPPRVDNNASLASGRVRDYVRSLVLDLARAYPDVDGFRFDWPEYPPYHFLSLFADFNPAVRPYAAEAGIDFDALRHSMSALLRAIADRSLPAGRLEAAATPDRFLAELAAAHPGVRDHLRLRKHLTTRYAHFLREAVDAAAPGKSVFLHGFPPPWNTLSGFSPAEIEPVADLVGIKFYTMHWPMMVRNYAEQIVALSGADRDRTAVAVSRLLVGQAPADGRLASIAYPEPDEPHGIEAGTISAKFGEAQAGVGRPLIGVAHGYGPTEDVTQRFSALWAATGGRVDINRYGYLSDEKLAAIAAVVSG